MASPPDKPVCNYLLQQLQYSDDTTDTPVITPGIVQTDNINGNGPSHLETLAEVTVKNEPSEVASLPPRRKKMKLSKDEKVCGVCGDKALGCNFDAVSCESCKAFFRRNAFKEEQMKCLFDGNCRIDVNTRRFCPYCRLNKCFLIGMRKELILGEDEKKRRLEKVHVNRTKKKDKPDETATQSSPQPSFGSVSFNCSDPTNMLTLLLCHNPVSPPLCSPKPIICEIGGPSRQLTQEETLWLNKIETNYLSSFTIDLDPSSGLLNNNSDLNHLINQSTVTVLKQIKFAKQLEDFAQLPQDVQIKMLKASVLSVLFIRSIELYDMGQDVWRTHKGDIPTSILKSATGYEELHIEHVEMSKKVKQLIGNDKILLALMVILILFTPEVCVLSFMDQMANIQDKYTMLLKHYLEARYSYNKASTMFIDILHQLKQLRFTAENHGKVLLDVNPTQVEPIMLEILDLK